MSDGCWSLFGGSWLLVLGCWLLIVDRWRLLRLLLVGFVLFVGCWLLAGWLLVVWLLVVGCRVRRCVRWLVVGSCWLCKEVMVCCLCVERC